MAYTTPNKEVVRRICRLSGASECYINIETGDEYVELLANIEESELVTCTQELKNWCGMKFRLYSFDNKSAITANIKTHGEKILPIKL